MTRFLMSLTIVLALALASLGCGGGADREAGEQGAGVASTHSAPRDLEMAEGAARIAREIESRPDQADAILERYGTTRQEFEKMLYDIAADPELSGAYQRALGR